MEGYDEATYGDRMADVYDDWYGEITDTAACVERLRQLAGGGPVLELGVGTGRLAIPLAAQLVDRGSTVYGLDASAAMLARLGAKDPLHAVRPVLGQMPGGLPPGPFGLVFAAYNTFFALPTAADQAACLAAVARRLAPRGVMMIETFVPGPDAADSADSVTVRSISVDRVVLSVSHADAETQTMEGHYIDITELGGVRLRPWSIRYSTPAQLDAMAAAAGLELAGRWQSFVGERFHADSPRQVSAYARPADRVETSRAARKVLG